MGINVVLTTDPKGEDDSQIIYNSFDNPDENPPFNSLEELYEWIDNKKEEIGKEIYIKKLVMGDIEEEVE